MIQKFLSPEVVHYAEILLAGLPVAVPKPLTLTLTPQELSRCVTLLGKGWRLQQAIDRIQAERPTLPFEKSEVA
jgi:hypothetical protein